MESDLKSYHISKKDIMPNPSVNFANFSMDPTRLRQPAAGNTRYLRVKKGNERWLRFIPVFDAKTNTWQVAAEAVRHAINLIGGGFRYVNCPTAAEIGPCPICSFLFEATHQANLTDAAKKQIGDFRAKPEFLSPVVDVQAPQTGVQIWRMAERTYGRFAGDIARYGPGFLNPQTGFPISVRADETGPAAYQLQYNFAFVQQPPYPLPQEWMDASVPLVTEELRFEDEATMRSIVDNNLAMALGAITNASGHAAYPAYPQAPGGAWTPPAQTAYQAPPAVPPMPPAPAAPVMAPPPAVPAQPVAPVYAQAQPVPQNSYPPPPAAYQQSPQYTQGGAVASGPVVHAQPYPAPQAPPYPAPAPHVQTQAPQAAQPGSILSFGDLAARIDTTYAQVTGEGTEE